MRGIPDPQFAVERLGLLMRGQAKPRGIAGGPGLHHNPVNFAGRSTNTIDPRTASNVNWIEDFLEEICSFPNSPHDDQLDAVSTAIQMMEGQRRIARAF